MEWEIADRRYEEHLKELRRRRKDEIP